MRTQILSLLLCFAFTAHLHAQAHSVPEPASTSVAQTETPSPTTESTWTLNRIAVGSLFTLLVGTGVYYIMKPEQKRLIHRTLASSPVVANQGLANNPVNPPIQNPIALDPDFGFDKDQLNAAIQLSLLMQKQLEITLEDPILEESEVSAKTEDKPIIQNEPDSKKPTKRKIRSNLYLKTNGHQIISRFREVEGMEVSSISHGGNFKLNGEAYVAVNTETDFTNLNIHHTILGTDEILVMDEQTQADLEQVYITMLYAYENQFPFGCSNERLFFAFLIDFVRTQVFDVSLSRSVHVAALIKEILENENIRILKSTESALPIINLSYYIKKRVGVCRHYTLVLGYLVKRFIDSKTINCLTGGSVHIGAGEAHVWCIYLNPEHDAGFHIDAQWDFWTQVGVNLESETLNRSIIERMIDSDKRHFFEESQVDIQSNALENSGTPEWLKEAGIHHFSLIEDGTEEDNETPEWLTQAGIFDFSEFPEDNEFEVMSDKTDS